MTKKELLKELTEQMQTRSDEEIFFWFVKLNKRYKRLLKEGRINDDIMIELTDFWHTICNALGDDFKSWLEEMWDYKTPALLRDINAFLPTYYKRIYEKYLEKMDDFEIEEAELLADAILSKNLRADIQCELYEWDSDECLSLSLTIPRIDRDDYIYDLKKICAMMIYNRGTMIVGFYGKRGTFEIAGVKALNGTGEWSCLSEEELSSCFDEGLSDNEKAIVLEHKQNRKMEEISNTQASIMYFDVIRRAAGK